MRIHKSDYATDGPMRCGISFSEAISEGYSYVWENVTCQDCISQGYKDHVTIPIMKQVLQFLQWMRIRGTVRAFEKALKENRIKTFKKENCV